MIWAIVGIALGICISRAHEYVLDRRMWAEIAQNIQKTSNQPQNDHTVEQYYYTMKEIQNG